MDAKPGRVRPKERQLSVLHYPSIVDRSASGYGVTFPDLPGCIAAGDTVEDAVLNAEAALALHLEGMVQDGDAIPAPSSLQAIEPDDEADDVARIPIRAAVLLRS
jgi:predicted RNase H-like HicB family nuclease